MYRYTLQKYRPGSKTACPSCGRTRCFTLYVDASTQEPLDPTCGICDHANSCGYHLRPREFFARHLQRRSTPPEPQNKPAATLKKPPCTLDPQLVAQSHSKASVLFRWLGSLIADPQALERIYEQYRLGATRNGSVIYWQIDTHQRVRSGKIMAYTPDGHRTGSPGWAHARLINSGRLASDFELTQCLFGEHLLPHTTSTVILVESEKTALLCAALYPQYTWIATGGCGLLSAEKCRPLIGRRLAVLPDSGSYHKWKQQLDLVPGLDYAISQRLEAYPPNTDIADLIVAELTKKNAISEQETPFLQTDDCPY